MHKTTSEIKAYFQSLNHLLTNDKVLVKLPTRIGIAPSYLGIAEANKYLQLNVSLLAQNVAVADAGAYTGQVSYRMLQDFHINHVLVGHSEVRQMLNETDTLLNAKVKLLLSNKFTVVLCVGESLNDFETQQTMQVITKQLTTGLKDCHEHLEQLIIAYEPI
jgi:triosephosphate isomerase